MVAVVLLGAGASYGSGDATYGKTVPCTPPLGNDLFAALEQQVGGVAAALPDALKAAFRANFEGGMAEYYEHSKGNIMRFQRELAQYLAQFRPGPSNVYVQLVEALGVHRVIYCSLNYDLLFELSAARLGLSCVYGVESKAKHARLLKPHGSCNFWPDIPVGVLRGVTFEGNSRADIQAPVRSMSQDETLRRCALEDSVAPAIAMYAQGKAVKICPDYVERQQALWRESILRAKKVFVTGVRLNRSDVHIWEVLAECRAAVTYFGFESDRHAFFEWKESVGKKAAFFVEADFRRCVSFIDAQLN
jgi:hypothetical protein